MVSHGKTEERLQPFLLFRHRQTFKESNFSYSLIFVVFRMHVFMLTQQLEYDATEIDS